MGVIRDQFGPFTVPPGHYFGMGDNRDNSLDSRFWGPIPRANIFGRPFLIYWSYEAESNSHVWRGAIAKIEQLAGVSPSTSSRGRDGTGCSRWSAERRLRRADRRAPPAVARARDVLEAVLVAVILALFVRTFLFQAYVVPTGSMEDNILVGDHLVVNKFLYAPRARPARDAAPAGARHPRRRRLRLQVSRRSAAATSSSARSRLPGDVVEIRDKVVYVNHAPLAEPEVTHADRDVYAAGRRDQFGPMRVPEGQIFALGDNRDESNDSRFWGTVPLAERQGTGALRLLVRAAGEPPGRSLRRAASRTSSGGRAGSAPSVPCGDPPRRSELQSSEALRRRCG